MKKIVTTKRQLIRSAWQRGILRYKLKPHQPVLYDGMWRAITSRKSLKHFINCSRRFGKTHILCLIAIEFAIRNPGAMIRFAAPTALSLRKSVFPIMAIILADCPTDLKPVFKGQDGMFEFNNGSQIHLSGTDNGHHESLRGTKSDLNLVDEAGFMDNLEYIVRSILIPQTLTCNGFTLISSTPPKTPDHDCSTIYKECQEAGDFSLFTIDDNTSVTEEVKELYAKEAGGYESTTYRREYKCEYVTDSEQAIIPDWNDIYCQDIPRDEYFRYYHKYVSLDTGVRDYTAALFAYYDFRNSRLIIEDEYTINGPEMTTDVLADGIRDKEKALWNDQLPVLRTADNNNLIIIQDLTRFHSLPFSPTTKSSLEAMVNQVRVMTREGRLYIHPRCEMLLGCIRYGVWAKNSQNGKMAFGRSKIYGHYDHLASLIYLCRNIDTYTNPIPQTHNLSTETHWINNSLYEDPNTKALAAAFTRPYK